ncbi:Holliday junction branch migration protein RuvA [bacterium]|nr:Holliday junction branch migration protein RuvA [bacterium]
MISFLSGILEHKEANQAIIDVGGVGYEVIIPSSTYEKLPPKGEPVKLHTHYLSRNDEIKLYGFISLDERTLFRTVLTVKGVGPGGALNILSKLTPNQFRMAINQNNVDALRRVPRLGKETAQLIIVQLKKKIQAIKFAEQLEGETSEPVFIEVVQTLVRMGAAPNAAEQAVRRAQKVLGENAQLEALIQLALRYV